MDNGFIKLSRKITDSDIWANKPSWWLKVWMHILVKVNFADSKRFKRGSNYFTYKDIYQDCYLSNDNVKIKTLDNVMRWLRSCEMIETVKTTRGFVISVCNYDIYQNDLCIKNDSQNDTQTTQKRHANDTQTTLYNKKKRIKEEKNNIYISEAVENFENDLQDYVPPPADDSPAEQVQIAWTKTTGLMVRPKDRLTLENYVNSKGVDWCLQAIQNRNKETYIGQCFFAYEQKTKPKQLPGKTVYDPSIRLFED